MKRGINLFFLITIFFNYCGRDEAWAMQQEGVYQWRYSSNEQTAYLHSADSDSTDNFGSFAFSCKLHSGVVEIEAHINEKKRDKFAQILLNNVYPKAALSAKSSDVSSVVLDKILYGDLYGWQYILQIENEDINFARFERTGQLQITIGESYRDGIELRVGLKEVAKFRQNCRKTPPNAQPG